MTREIKFRGKHLDNGAWEYGSLLNIEDTCFIIEKGDFDFDYRTENHAFWFDCTEKEVNPDTIGQYTELTDKNGKEIYEGDILCAKGRVIGYVKGGVRGYCYDVVYINHPAGESDWPLYSTVKYDYPEEIEVIGNIHDNPELLEGGEE